MRRVVVISAALWACGSAAALAAPSWPRTDLRPAMDLDGTWQFRMDPEGVGEAARWFDPALPYPDRITVPGCWDAQGFGAPTDKVFHNYVGKAWYRRTIVVPREWAGKRVFLRVGGVHRYADVWVNGQHLHRHVGYVAPFDVDVTPALRAGEPNTVAIRVDSKQDWAIDSLTGAFDIIDYLDVNWGGIWSHVGLEARESVWVESAFVKPSVRDSRVDVEVECHAEASARRVVAARVLDPDGRSVARTESQVGLVAGATVCEFPLPVPQPKLWSPNHPSLYRVQVELRDGPRAMDRWEDRFGMREIEVRGPDLYLNGRRLFLHGYGDDTIYPETIVPPADIEVHRARFRRIKEFGLNYVRHHSTVPVPEYFEAADEAGVLVQPELPIAYQQFLQRGMEHEASRQLYFATWEAMIRRNRNHPSAFGWCMGNELYGALNIAPELYDLAKRLDPTRPVYDSDGANLSEQSRRTLDILPVQFDVAVIPVLANSGKYHMDEPPTKPILSHEMGNFTTFPDLRDLPHFRSGIRPFWLTETRDQLERKGLLGEADLWLRNSSLLQAACFKLETEAVRRSPWMDGHALWLFQDYWTGTSGLVNSHFKVKGVGAEFYRRFLDDTVLLADLPDYCFEAGEDIRVPMAVSDFGEADLAGRHVLWSLDTTQGRSLRSGTLGPLTNDKGLLSLGAVSIRLPVVTKPERLVLRMRLDTPQRPRQNEWSIWVFPRAGVPVAPGGVRVMGRLDRDALEWIVAGGTALLTRPERLLPSESATFEPAWWKGSPGGDSHVGTVICDTPALRRFPHEGWCDLQFLRLQHERPALLTDGLGLRAGTLIRAIDCHMGNREKAFLVEARIGRGKALLCSLDLSAPALRERPEARWLLRCLLDYVSSPAFAPTPELGVDDLRKRMASSLELGEVTRVEGFARVTKHIGETTTEARYCLGTPRAWVVRGMDGSHTLEWETAPLPESGKELVCFAFAGGLGWISEPECQFTLQVGDLPAVRFGVVQRESEWHNEDGSVRLVYSPQTIFGPDSLGVFRIVAPRSAFAPGKPARIRVTTSASNSKRWMLLQPVTSPWGDE